MNMHSVAEMPRVVNSFDVLAFHTIEDYENGIYEWNQLVEKSYAELEECLFWNLKPEFVSDAWWTRKRYEWSGVCTEEPQDLTDNSTKYIIIEKGQP